MKRRDFLKLGATGLVGAAAGRWTGLPFVRIGRVFAASSGAWRFGVMGDTQWTLHPGDSSKQTAAHDPAGQNPHSVAVSIINQVDPLLVNLGVKFVIQVGDLTDCGTTAAIAARAIAARTNLYPYGIGFFPVRGNHETYGTKYGDNNGFAIEAIRAEFPQTRGAGNVWGAYNFASCPVSPDLNGISYCFDYGGPAAGSARFLMLDTWATPSKVDNNEDGYAYGYTAGDQQAWIGGRLDKGSRGTDHAFVITHQPLMAEDHRDTIFSGYTNANPHWQNAFYASLRDNGVRYYISGHDHMHQRSIIESPDGRSKIQELVCASCSSKFYTPKPLTAPEWFGQKYRETPISQELYTVGFYVFTVDGPLVTVDYYSDTIGKWQSDAAFPAGPAGQGGLVTPTLNFTKKESWGYSLNGAEFLINEGAGFTTAKIDFLNTTATVGKSSAAVDYTGRSFTRALDAWYAPKGSVTGANAVSDVLALAGVTGMGAAPTDTYVLTMSYDPSLTLAKSDLNHGLTIAINTRDGDGKWMNAADANTGGHGKFVYGPYDKSSPLGTHGIDTNTKTAWAVLNHDGEFAVMKTGNRA